MYGKRVKVFIRIPYISYVFIRSHAGIQLEIQKIQMESVGIETRGMRSLNLNKEKSAERRKRK